MIGEPTGYKPPDMNHVGTRLEHMMELQNTWSTCYGILTRPHTWHSPLEEQRAEQLSIALDLLQHHMEAEYNGTSYAVAINSLPKDAKEIPVDRKIDPDSFTTHRDTV